RLPAVDRHGRVGAGDRNRARRVHLEARPDQRAREGRRAVGVADEAVGEDEGEPVHRAGRRDAVAKVADTAQVLNGGLRPWVEDPDHVITGAWARAATRAAIVSYSPRSIARKLTRSPGRSRTGSGDSGS